MNSKEEKKLNSIQMFSKEYSNLSLLTKSGLIFSLFEMQNDLRKYASDRKLYYLLNDFINYIHCITQDDYAELLTYQTLKDTINAYYDNESDIMSSYTSHEDVFHRISQPVYIFLLSIISEMSTESYDYENTYRLLGEIIYQRSVYSSVVQIQDLITILKK